MKPTERRPAPPSGMPRAKSVSHTERLPRIEAARRDLQDRPAPSSDAVRHDEPADTHEPLTSAQKRSLTFLQVNTPLSLLVFLATALFGAVVVPSIGFVFTSHATYFTPNPRMLLAYFVITLVFQTGFCILSVITRNCHTQRCIVQSTGARLALANYLLALWLVLRILDTSSSRKAGAWVLGIVAVLAFVNDTVLRSKFAPRWVHPFETILVHVPNKLVTLIVIQTLLWNQVMLAKGWFRRNDNDLLPTEPLWPSAVIQILVGVALAMWVGMTTDVSVYAASMYLDMSILAFKKMPVLGPNSRPFLLSWIMLASMTIRTIAFVIPSMLKNGCLVICHMHDHPRLSFNNDGHHFSDIEASQHASTAEDNERTPLRASQDPAYGTVQS